MIREPRNEFGIHRVTNCCRACATRCEGTYCQACSDEINEMNEMYYPTEADEETRRSLDLAHILLTITTVCLVLWLLYRFTIHYFAVWLFERMNG